MIFYMEKWKRIGEIDAELAKIDARHKELCDEKNRLLMTDTPDNPHRRMPRKSTVPLLANIVHDPSALSLGKPEPTITHASFVTPEQPAGQLRHQEERASERRRAGGW